MNENWRIMLALVLTMLVLVGWNIFFPTTEKQTAPQKETAEREQREPEKAEQQKERTESALQKVEEKPAKGIVKSDYQKGVAGRSVQVNTPLYFASFNAQGGILEQFELKKYRQSIKDQAQPINLITDKVMNKAPFGLLWNNKSTWDKGEWTLTGQDLNLKDNESGFLEFTGNINGLIFKRRLEFQADTYLIEEELSILNQSQVEISGSLAGTIASQKLVADESRFNRTSMVYYDQSGLNSEDDEDDLKLGIISDAEVKWGGISSNYFMLALVPVSENMHFKGKYEEGVYRLALEERIVASPKQSTQLVYDYYLGPRIKSHLQGTPNNLKAALHYGWLDIIAKPLVSILQFFHNYVGNYGIAIILLTIVIKIVFWPLSHKSYKSMEQMKKIQPMMKKLKEQYKDDRQKMNQELMRLYKTYKVNPAGGCLPMLLQIPVFIALYEALMGSIELRHSPFITHVPFTDIVWLADLSAKDPLYVTPILMGASMFLQQKLSPTAGDPTQAKVMMFMPIFLTFIFLNFPSGLVVYFITNNILSIAQQWWMLRKA